MKQVEFDEALRMMRVDREAKTSQYKKMIADLDLIIAEHGKALHKMYQEYEELKTRRCLLHKEKQHIEMEFNEKYRDFIKNNEGHVSRNLCDVSEWALVNELAARGFTIVGGALSHPDHAEDWLQQLNQKLNPDNEPQHDNSEND